MKKELSRDDIYGSYIIDRTKYPGIQADWQYNHFRFEIKEDNTITFYQTENVEIIKKSTGTIRFHESYHSPRLIIDMGTEPHHIIEDNPTLYRTVWSF